MNRGVNLFIVLIKNNKIMEKFECNDLTISTDEKPTIRYTSDKGESSMRGVKADIYVLDQCEYEVGQELTDAEIASLDNKKDNYIVRTVEQELARKDEQIKSMQRAFNNILFQGMT